ncbi:MAG TPA: energy-coupling factor transporter transmembrane component T [Aggregatilineales bacterium]|nr:energy-coupling factor transporter transmembrane protein EcfT [Chloroflexota bacterium]HOA25078.1 energy-coupling factor transporter transmembrane component T [Aggregatilineales bacterium]HPV07321.1 energy-coupling factor transporter transmembrane component T [Aggregatilineales bacterium]HQA67156.1 energy-coupling factor transporter transmembrane component T [Aggregatilineales bacterium]HQE18833.1 energy-coupling factor transporter transmembrane component T [Aggregatilineales bacterium]
MSQSQHSLNYIEHDSPMHRVYPLVKLIWVLLVAIGLFFYRTPLSGAVMFGVILLTAMIFARVSLRNVLSSAKLIFGLGLLLMLFHFFADPGEPVYRLGPLTITDGGLREGPIFFFRLSVVVLASFVLIWTTHPRDLMVSLNKAGVPYRYAFAVFLAMRFLPLIQREVDAVKAAHSIRGRAGRSGLLHRFKLWQRYMFTVLINGLRKAESTAIAIECRGFGAYPDRTYMKPVEYQAGSLLLIVLFVVLQTGLIVAERVL